MLDCRAAWLAQNTRFASQTHKIIVAERQRGFLVNGNVKFAYVKPLSGVQ